MADKKISALTGASTPLGGTEVLPIVQSGSTVKVSVADLTAGRSVATGPLTSTHTSGAGVTVTRGTKSLELSGNYAGGDVFSAITATAGMDIALLSGGSEILRAVNTGNVNINNGNLVIGTSGKGIDFSADPSAAGMTSELLDDYEEGTFTPTIVGSSSAGTGTYSANGQIGRYTKIGNRVCFEIYLSWSNHTGTGNLRVDGLPFVTANATNAFHTFSVYCSNLALSASNVLQMYSAPNTTQIVFSQYATGGSGATAVAMDTAGEIMVTGSYEV